jgi:hypothetical protein
MAAGFHEHVDWFEEPARYPVQWSLVISWRTSIALVVALVAVGALYAAHRLLHHPHWPRLPFLPRMAIGAPGASELDAKAGVASATVNTAQHVGGSLGTALPNTVAAGATWDI